MRAGWHYCGGMYTYDDRDPKNFYLCPGPAAAVKVDVIYSVAPQSKVLADVENVGTPALADLDDIYINPLIDFIMYRAFSRTQSTAPTQSGGRPLQRLPAATG